MAEEQRSPTHIVVLIHGTWGRGIFPRHRSSAAAWCAHGSPCRRAIEEALGPQVLFIVFNWTGGNNVRARKNAASALVTTVENARLRLPMARVLAVAHSHGGNVALYAHSMMSKAFDSIVFLSTPFLVVSPRTVPTAIRTALAPGWPGLVTVFAALSSRFQGFQGLAVLPWLVALMLAFGWGAFWKSRPSKSNVLAASTHLPDRLEYASLILRASADEAASALGFAQLTSRMLTWQIAALSRLVSTESRQENRQIRGIEKMKDAIYGFPRYAIGTALIGAALIFGSNLGSELALWSLIPSESLFVEECDTRFRNDHDHASHSNPRGSLKEVLYFLCRWVCACWGNGAGSKKWVLERLAGSRHVYENAAVW